MLSKPTPPLLPNFGSVAAGSGGTMPSCVVLRDMSSMEYIRRMRGEQRKAAEAAGRAS